MQSKSNANPANRESPGRAIVTAVAFGTVSTQVRAGGFRRACPGRNQQLAATCELSPRTEENPTHDPPPSAADRGWDFPLGHHVPLVASSCRSRRDKPDGSERSAVTNARMESEY